MTTRACHATLVFVILAGCPALAHAQRPTGARVLTADPAVLRLLDDGAARSPTFASLLKRLERTNWLVFVQRGPCPVPAAVACLLHTVGRFEGQPYLRVRVDHWRAGHPDREISSLGHELQHALEAAETAGVSDSANLAALFRRIGRVAVRSPRGTAYETTAAQRMGELVLRELQSREPTAARAASAG